MNLSDFITPMLIGAYYAGGREGVKRALTIPEATIRRLCKQRGSNPTEAIAARDEAVEKFVAFIEQIVVPDK